MEDGVGLLARVSVRRLRGSSRGTASSVASSAAAHTVLEECKDDSAALSASDASGNAVAASPLDTGRVTLGMTLAHVLRNDTRESDAIAIRESDAGASATSLRRPRTRRRPEERTMPPPSQWCIGPVCHV